MSDKRFVSKKTVQKVLSERDRSCIYGLYEKDPCSGGLQVHHITKRSQFGDDVPENLITLCARHHDLAEKRMIAPGKFRQALSFFYGYDFAEEISNPSAT